MDDDMALPKFPRAEMVTICPGQGVGRAVLEAARLEEARGRIVLISFAGEMDEGASRRDRQRVFLSDELILLVDKPDHMTGHQRGMLIWAGICGRPTRVATVASLTGTQERPTLSEVPV